MDGGGPRLKSCMTPTELHCKFQRSVIPPEYSSTDSDSRGAISVHSGLTDLFCFLSSLWSHFNPSHVFISSLEMESLLRINLDGKIMTALYYLTEPKFRAKADLMNSQ